MAANYTPPVVDFSGRIHLSSPNPSSKNQAIDPANLSLFVPQGEETYGYDLKADQNPFDQAPVRSGTGGTVYFDRPVLAVFEPMLQCLGVTTINPNRQFAAFFAASEDPKRDNYLMQLRLVSRFGLRYLFKSIDEAEYQNFPEQPLNMIQACWEFVCRQREIWREGFWRDEQNGLAGLFGGDGDYQRESLSFGFTVENSYYNVYRIWSRAYLVTK